MFLAIFGYIRRINFLYMSNLVISYIYIQIQQKFDKFLAFCGVMYIKASTPRFSIFPQCCICWYFRYQIDNYFVLVWILLFLVPQPRPYLLFRSPHVSKLLFHGPELSKLLFPILLTENICLYFSSVKVANFFIEGLGYKVLINHIDKTCFLIKR